MSKKLYSVIAFVLLMVLAGSALAADDNWTNNNGDGWWFTPGNWALGRVPDQAINQDKAKILRVAPNDAHINAGDAAECTWICIGDGQPGGLHMTGGTLNVSAPPPADTWSIVGYSSTDVGELTIDTGATMTTSNRVYIGVGGHGTLNMNGGTLNVGGSFGIGYGEGATTGVGTVNLTSGAINVAGSTFTMEGGTGKLDITGGTLTLTGNKTAVVNGYVTSGKIVAFGGLGDVVVALNGSNTVVTGAVNLTKAKVPYPANGATGVPPYATLTWVAGYATTHDIYFGTDSNSVLNATTSTTGIYQGSQPRGSESFEPAGLQFGKKYYWRIDEVNDPCLYKGNLWQFTVDSNVLVDDFEKYADSTAMLASWSNGSTGATLTLAATGGHLKAKTMKFDYNNSASPYYSEAQKIDADFDWTIDGVVAIDIWHKGDAGNAAVPMYAALEDNNSHPVAVIVNPDANAVKDVNWTPWRIKLSDFTGVNLTNIKKFYLGFGDRNTPASGGSGTVYFDDIRLYLTRCLDKPPEDLNGDCVVDFRDFAIMANNWLISSEI